MEIPKSLVDDLLKYLWMRVEEIQKAVKYWRDKKNPEKAMEYLSTEGRTRILIDRITRETFSAPGDED